MPRCGQCIELEMRRTYVAPVVRRYDRRVAMSDVFAERRIECETRDVPCELRVVAREQAVDPLTHEIPHAAREHRDYREAGRPRLQCGDTERLALAWQHERV